MINSKQRIQDKDTILLQDYSLCYLYLYYYNTSVLYLNINSEGSRRYYYN